MKTILPQGWNNLLKKEIEKEYFVELQNKVEHAYSISNVFPKKENIYRLFELVELNEVKVVIIGQDPYHGQNQADGLAFSVQRGNKIPPSLKNIFNEIALSMHIYNHSVGDLSTWAEQGVFLLNCLLTVEEAKPLSHKKFGWERFTDAVISLISEKRDGVIFLLWGSKAIAKKKLIDDKKHFILESVHPSPLSAYRGFIGNNHFKRTNEILIEQNKSPIDWSLK